MDIENWQLHTKKKGPEYLFQSHVGRELEMCIIFWRCVGRNFRRSKCVGEAGKNKNE